MALGPTLRLALLLSLGLLGLRLNTAHGLGFGDAEALYACYALHPQPAYLDHPGFIGYLLRLLGGGTAPTAESAHVASSTLATLVPWLAALGVRASGLSWERAARAVVALALVPELSVGLFGVTPDLPLAVLWLTALALAIYLLRLEPTPQSRIVPLTAWLGLGVVLGLAILAKVSAVLLALALLLASLRADVRQVWRGLGPWCTVICTTILVAPLIVWELKHDFSMLEHRLIASQTGAGFSLRNLLKLLGGQLVYVTPPFLVAAWLIARDLHRHRRIDVLSGTLWWTLVLPLLALGMLALWSDRAEPHWIAPALLPLSIHIGRSELISKRLARACLITGALFTLAVWASVKTNVFIWLANSAGELFGGYQPRYDLTNDLHAWGPGRSLLQQAVQSAVQRNGQMPTVVGTPHWMICAQAQVAVGKELAVGCYAVLPSDFDRWMPRQQWHKAHTLLLVQDSRYPVDVEREFPSRRSVATWRTQVRRGSHVVRTIHITELENTTGTAHWFDANHSAAETLPALGR